MRSILPSIGFVAFACAATLNLPACQSHGSDEGKAAEGQGSDLDGGSAPAQDDRIPSLNAPAVGLAPGYVDGALKGREFFVGNSLSGADIQMSFVGEMAKIFNRLGPYPNLSAWLSRMHARPAFQRSVEKGGAYRFAK